MTSYPLNDGWFFTPRWDEALLRGEGAELVPVRLPHTVAELPLDSFDDAGYQLLSGYVRTLDIPAEWAGRLVRLILEGAAQRAEVFCNGIPVGVHACGWTAGEFDLSDALRPGEENILAIRLDSRETLDQPPFGGVVDYLGYGGLYREARLDVSAPARIIDLFARADHRGVLDLEIDTSDEARGHALEVTVADDAGAILATGRLDPVTRRRESLVLEVPGARPWSPEDPALHTVSALLIDEDGADIDRAEIRTGFRSVEWGAEGLAINGRIVPIRGLNRHQAYPVLGYAAPARAQRRDADILRDELGCTLVRTSHYPQSHHFIDRCDELGLLVLTEIPGWQHIGGAEWKDLAVQNTRDMVRQWRNHPSIIAWGVRINESPDDDGLYARTNAAARELDPTRPTTGIRNFPHSHLLEDVYAYNDFVHSGANRGVDPKAKITPDPSKGYLVSEHNGHMFPTKSTDDEEHRLSQALRHARVLDDALAAPGIAGAVGWCMTDYHTHRDFGSGDRVCHHGVMDQFRNPKLAAALYASQAEGAPVLVPSSSMDIGEHPGGALGTIAVFTNADAVRLFRNEELVGEFRPDRSAYPGLPHPPILIEDRIGDLLERHEGMDRRTAERVKRVLRDAAEHGATGMTPRSLATAAWLAATKRFTLEEGTRLYNTWIASWGGEAVVWRFDAVKDGEVVASSERTPGKRLLLEADVDTRRLVDADTWDMASIRVRALDEYGAPRVYARRVLRFALEGDAELIGPDAVALWGGAAGTAIRTLGRSGSARLTITCEGAEALVLDFDIAREEAPTWK